MAARIENLTDKPLWLRLNNGESLIVPARAQSREVPDHEFNENPLFAKLIERRMARAIGSGSAAEPSHAALAKKTKHADAAPK